MGFSLLDCAVFSVIVTASLAALPFVCYWYLMGVVKVLEYLFPWLND